MIKLVCPYTIKLHPEHYLVQVKERSKFLLDLFMKTTGKIYDFTLYTDDESYEFLGTYIKKLAPLSIQVFGYLL